MLSRCSKLSRRCVKTRFLSSSPSLSTPSSVVEGVTIVNDAASAERALETIRELEVEDPDRIHACDTEVTDIDLKVQSPCGNGKVICASVYAGPDVDFGNGPKLWIDNLDEAEGTLDLFKDYFQNNRIRKVWHNYGFDRHVLYVVFSRFKPYIISLGNMRLLLRSHKTDTRVTHSYQFKKITRTATLKRALEYYEKL